MKTLLSLVFLFLSLAQQLAAAGQVEFSVSGLESGDRAVVSLGSDSYLATQVVEAAGSYSFADVPAGRHFVKVEASGYNLPQAQAVVVSADGSVAPAVPLRLVVTKMEADSTLWTHSWQEDGSLSGYVTTAHINEPPQIDFLGKKIVPSDVPSVGILQSNYHIILCDDDRPWTQEYAYRLLETLKTIPHIPGDAYAKFVLTAGPIADDIRVTDLGGGKEVVISEEAFYYANPFLVNMDGVRGRFFSKRLHHALVNYVTDFGRDRGRVNGILYERFGCSIEGIDYEALTAGITNEDASCFQEFIPSELVAIINMFEELPEGFHKTPHLNYLIRRQNGHPHPIYPEAAAVSWCVDNGYIEFMEGTFGGNNQTFETLRLILHEKTHFLWAFSFSDEIKADWIEVGGWYEDPNAAEGWSTTKDVEFVTAYAHGKNPDEDMAESVAYYIKNPEQLQSRAPEKYEFIRDRIMHGTRYISKLPENLTFEVLNLNPDYDYPGKIKRLDVKVAGAPEEDKVVTVEVELNHMEGFEDGASGGTVRVTSPEFLDQDGNKCSQFYDLLLEQVDGNDHLLRGSFPISKYSKSGYWTAGDIIVSDLQGNQRFEGRNDCVWNMYVDNPLEDVEAPRYESGSLSYELRDTLLEGREAQNLRIRLKITDNRGLRENQPVMVRLNRGESAYSWDDVYGSWDAATQIATIDFPITEYFPTGDYYVETIMFYDLAETQVYVDFSDSPGHEPRQTIYIETPNPDTEAPQLDLNRISVYAEPTNKEAPDGETLVTINYYARDDKSGLGTVGYSLKDPQGLLHGEYHYHRNSHSLYFDGDPTVWERYTIKCILPKGSAPGIWGLAEMSLSDKAWNERTYNFVETLIFEPDDSQTDYVLFSELDEQGMLSLSLSSEVFSGYGFTYRIIHEESGLELDGAVSPVAKRSAYVPGAQVDVSSLPDGKLVVIVLVEDAAGEVVAVRSATVDKGETTALAAPGADGTLEAFGGQGKVTLRSPVPQAVFVCTVDGRWMRRLDIAAGVTELPLPPGLYIVGGRKCLVL